MLGRPVVVLMSLMWVVCQPNSAEACSCISGTGIHTSVPAMGETDVPLNVVPWVIAGGNVELRDDQGNVVATENQFVPPLGFSCYGGTELLPSEPLLPNTQYTIAAPDATPDQGQQGGALSQGTASVTFTTGTRVLEPNEAAAPETNFVALDAAELTNSCVYAPNQACLWTDAQGLLEVRVMNGEQEYQRYLSTAQSVASLELGDVGTADCVEVRTRDVAGQRSQPAKHCFDDTQLPHLSRTDFSGGPLIDCSAPAVTAALNGEVPTRADAGSTAPEPETSAPQETSAEAETAHAAATSTDVAQTAPSEQKRAVTPATQDGAACSVKSPASPRSGLGGTLVLMLAAAAVFMRRGYWV